MGKYYFILLMAVIFLSNTHTSFAEYVLPYPSYMPGNKVYKISRLVGELKKYWYWGSIASFKYHLGLSDKYLVEAKTLFEYKQYLLARDALARSNENFRELPQYLIRAKNEGKDMRIFNQQIQKAAAAHMGVIDGLARLVPKTFNWREEKKQPVELGLQQLLTETNKLRQSVALEMRK